MGRQDSRLWPVLVMLLVAALLPTACVLWFMGEAVRNERLAARQRLLEAYRAPLDQVRGRLDDFWTRRMRELPAYEPETAASAVFEACVERNCGDSVVLYHPPDVIRYPEPAAGTQETASAPGPEWEAAEALEFRADDPRGAAELYLEIARSAGDLARAAQARIAGARCVNKDGRKSVAVSLLKQILDDPDFRETRDSYGRLLQADAALLALELLGPAEDAHQQIAHWLALLAADYRHGLLPAAQRRVIMERLAPSVGAGSFPTFAAERLAAEYVEAQPSVPAAGRLTRSPLTGVWRLTSAEGTATALYRDSRLRSDLAAILQSEAFSGATIRLLEPDEHGPESFLATAAADTMPGWQLVLSLNGPDPFTDEVRRRTSLYLWTGLAVALLTVLLTLLVGRHVGRQVRLTRLKNDLIATVSHELKTPLTSIRALVDTLLDHDAGDPRRTREYLQLVAKENLRLSRLIDNFLAFSRMERNRHAFDFTRIVPAEVVAAAVDAAGERFHSGGCRLDVHAAPDLPALFADRDALITVLLNLLDNAWKYTGDEKRLALRAYAANGRVCFEVRDNGIGLSRRAMRRVFDRFYQVDQSLSRKAGGCGLGLSIVKFIVEAHGGSVNAKSQPGKGSVFTICLPADSASAIGAVKDEKP